MTPEVFKIRLAGVLGEVDSWDQVADPFTDDEAVALLTLHRSKGAGTPQGLLRQTGR